MFMCLWSILFLQAWQRENARLVFEWDVETFDKFEPDLPDYHKKKKRIEMETDYYKKFLIKNDIYFKQVASLFFLFCLVGFGIRLLILCFKI